MVVGRGRQVRSACDGIPRQQHYSRATAMDLGSRHARARCMEWHTTPKYHTPLHRSTPQVPYSKCEMHVIPRPSKQTFWWQWVAVGGGVRWAGEGAGTRPFHKPRTTATLHARTPSLPTCGGLDTRPPPIVAGTPSPAVEAAAAATAADWGGVGVGGGSGILRMMRRGTHPIRPPSSPVQYSRSSTCRPVQAVAGIGAG